MKKKIDLNERMAASGACGCGHAADDHGHEPDSHAGHDCCGGTADHAPEHQHAENCCRGSRIAASTQDRDGLPVTAEGEGQ